MAEGELASAVKVRPTTAADVQRIVDISLRMWDGEDYIPNVVDEWMNSEEGAFVVAEVGGVVAGFARLAFHGRDHGWLEGLRVDPDYRRRGIGRAIGRHLINLAVDAGVSTLRFSTAVDNRESIAMNEAMGFVRIGGGRWMECEDPPWSELAAKAEAAAETGTGTGAVVEAGGEAAPVGGIAAVRLSGSDVAEDSGFVRDVLASNVVAAVGGMLPAGFVFYPAEPAFVTKLARDGYAYTAGTGQSRAVLLASIWSESSSEKPGVVISVLEGERGSCLAILSAAFRDFAKDGIGAGVATVPCESIAYHLLREMGFSSWMEEEVPAHLPTVLLYDYPVEAGLRR